MRSLVLTACLLTLSLATEVRNCTDGPAFTSCLDTGCCTDSRLACYKRPNREHAVCMERKPDCTDSDEWLCPGWELCGERRKSCQRSQCCRFAGDECYQKDPWYAQCMERGSCAGRIDPHTNVPWLCSVLHAPEYCSDDWQECTSTKCCKSAGFTCFEKSDSYAKCMRVCPDPASNEPFSCRIHDKAQIETSKLVSATPKHGTCSPNRGECTVASCCEHNDFTCYEKGPNYAECLRTGTCEDTWSTSASCTPRASPKGKDCAPPSGDCSSSNCCADPAFTCFQKDAWSHMARCMRGCTPGNPGLEGWECNVLDRSPPPAPPSPPPQAKFRATYGTTCASFKTRISVHAHACSLIDNEATCNERFRESSIAPTLPGAHVLEPCVWFQNTCATGGPVECTPAQVTYVPKALPHNSHADNALKLAKDAAKVQGAGADAVDAVAHQLGGEAPVTAFHNGGGAAATPSEPQTVSHWRHSARDQTANGPSGSGDMSAMVVVSVLVVALGACGVVMWRRMRKTAPSRTNRQTEETGGLAEAQPDDDVGEGGKKKKKKSKALAHQTEPTDMDL